MKKYLSVVICVMSALLFVACKNNVNEKKIESNDLKKFTVGFDAEYPPFGFLADDGKTYTGFDLELAKEVCNRNNLEFVAQPIDWDSKDLELNSGSIDCIWNGFTINGRETNYTWSKPYIDNSIVMIVRNDSNINTKNDLSGKIVIVQAGSSGLAALESEENADFVNTFGKLEQSPDYNTAFMDLESGVVDCVVVDIGVAKYQLKNKSNLFKQLPENVSSEQYGIGFKYGNFELRDLVENTLIDMYKDGTFMNIANKYSEYALSDSICFGDYIK